MDEIRCLPEIRMYCSINIKQWYCKTRTATEPVNW